MAGTNIGVPVAPNYPVWSTSGAIPKIYSTTLNAYFYVQTVAMNICNRTWEGAIKKQGDQVTIRSLPNVTVQRITKGGRMRLDTSDPPSIQFHVDKALGYGITIDDIDEYQTDIDWVNKNADHAVREVGIEIDAEMLQGVPASAHAANIGTTAGIKSGWANMGTAGDPIELDDTTIIRKITEMMLVLDEQNIPNDMRFVVLPHWAQMLIKNSELKDANIGGGHLLRSPYLGKIDRAEIYPSNQLLTVVDGGAQCTNILFGHKSAISYAGQVIKNKVTEPSDGFAQNLLGLNVYGWMVTKPGALGVCYATMAA